MTLAELQPYLAVISAALSVATLGFILNIVKAVRDNAQDRIAVQEERLKSAADDRARLKEWNDREVAELKQKLKDSKDQVDSLLKEAGIDASTLVSGHRISESAAELQKSVELLTEQMQETLHQLELTGKNGRSGTADGAGRTIAMADMARGAYAAAAAQYDVLAARGAATWQDHFSRGVAHANSRQGRMSDVAALVAYSTAIAELPDDIDSNSRARLFTYKGAILKRLGRLREALNDLSIALGLASDEYERLDTHYNFACVFALLGLEKDMYDHLEELRGNLRFLAAIEHQRLGYFAKFGSDARFIEKLSSLKSGAV